MVEIQVFHLSWLTYRTFPLHGRWSSHPKNQQSTDFNYLSVIGINFCYSFSYNRVINSENTTSNMENENPRVPPLWEHSFTTLLQNDPTSDPGIAHRQWVHFQGVHNILDLLSWDEEEIITFLPNRYTP